MGDPRKCLMLSRITGGSGHFRHVTLVRLTQAASTMQNRGSSPSSWRSVCAALRRKAASVMCSRRRRVWRLPSPARYVQTFPTPLIGRYHECWSITRKSVAGFRQKADFLSDRLHMIRDTRILSTRRPSRSTTSKRQPEISQTSPVSGRRWSRSMTRPAAVS